MRHAIANVLTMVAAFVSVGIHVLCETISSVKRKRQAEKVAVKPLDPRHDPENWMWMVRFPNGRFACWMDVAEAPRWRIRQFTGSADNHFLMRRGQDVKMSFKDMKDAIDSCLAINELREGIGLGRLDMQVVSVQSCLHVDSIIGKEHDIVVVPVPEGQRQCT